MTRKPPWREPLPKRTPKLPRCRYCGLRFDGVVCTHGLEPEPEPDETNGEKPDE